MNMQLSSESLERIYRLMRQFDTDPRVPMAFNEQKIVDLALVIFETANTINDRMTIAELLMQSLRVYHSEKG